MAEPLLSIPSSSATQLIPNPGDASHPTRVPLKTGVLTVSVPIRGSPKLLLEIDGLTIPLTADTAVRTHAKEENRYLIMLPLSPSSGDGGSTGTSASTGGVAAANLEATGAGDTSSSAPAGGHPQSHSGMIELTLPEFTDASTATRFEELLVQHDFLATGLVADADDLVSSIQSVAASIVDTIGGYAKNRIKTREPVEPSEASHYSSTTHSVVNSVASGTGKTADVTGKAADAVEGAGKKAGNYVGGKVGAGDGTKEVVQAVETLGGIGGKRRVL